MNRVVTGVVGAIAEAWAELRIHKTRVLLSLIGVGVAVAALTSVIGIGSIVQQATTETYERQSGRPATLVIGAYSTGPEQADVEAVSDAFRAVVDRYRIAYAGAVRHTSKLVQFVDGASHVNTTAVGIAYGEMHRVSVETGRWFSERDEQRLAPVLVVNEVLHARLVSPDLRTHPTLTMLGEGKVTGVVIGVVPSSEFDGPSMYMLDAAYSRIASPMELAQNLPMFEAWVPTELAQELTERIRRDMAGALGDSMMVDVSRQDYATWGDFDPLGPVKVMVTAVAILVLALGALGLVNISLVTLRQRIREIGIRRSFGATAPRVFFAVMMESVVASFVAGVAGVMLAIAVIAHPWVQERLTMGMDIDLPPFPVEAAIVGLAAATLVGAAAGLLPAVVAVRVKVIDAIRF